MIKVQKKPNTNTVEQVSFQGLPGLNGDVASADFVSSVCTAGPSATGSDNAEVSVTSTNSDKLELHFDFSLDHDDLFESRADYEQVSANIQSLLSSMKGSFSDMDDIIDILDVGLENSFSEPILTNSKSTELCDPKSTELCDPKSTELCDPKSTELSDPKSTELSDPKSREPLISNQQSFLIPNQQSFLIPNQQSFLIPNQQSFLIPNQQSSVIPNQQSFLTPNQENFLIVQGKNWTH